MRFPVLVYKLARAGALLTGSRAKALAGLRPPVEPGTDYDMLVPPEKWHLVAPLIPRGSTTNSFGGIKIQVPDQGGYVLDVWSGDPLGLLAEHAPEEVVLVDILSRSVFVRRAL